jgi:hypothetical protein
VEFAVAPEASESLTDLATAPAGPIQNGISDRRRLMYCLFYGTEKVDFTPGLILSPKLTSFSEYV